MRIGVASVLFVVALLVDTGANAAQNDAAILDVRVFDGERTRESVDVLVRDGRIVKVANALEIPDGVERYDGAGKTLLPGLIDAHVHVWGDARRDALRFGVTTVLDMFSDRRQLPAAKRQRNSLERSEQADMWSAGTLATAENGHGTQFGGNIPTLSSPGEAAAWVAERKREGSDYIKIIREDLSVYDDERRLPTLDTATTAALIDAAHDQGLKAVVHASARDVARQALEDGADGLAHAFQDASADESFVRLAKESRAFMIPTLTVTAGLSGEQSEIRDDPHIEPWLDAAQRDSLTARSRRDEPLPELVVNARKTVRRLHRAGVPILAGTDAPNPNTAHGASLHEELRQLTRAGLDNEAALAAATSVPADAFGLEDRGRIAIGSRADLLLVEGDPTADIGATRRIVGIWKNGWRVDRELPAQVLLDEVAVE